MIKLICIIFIGLAWGLYSLRFGIDFLSTQRADVWGQFGDFMGGVLNPILSFITVCLLIRSMTLQLDSNQLLQGEIKRQENLEEYKKFELRFFSLLEAQDSNFNKFRIVLEEEKRIESDNHGLTKPKIVHTEFKSRNAVSYIDDSLSVLIKAKTDSSLITSWLEDLDVDDHYFSLARRFYLLVKTVHELAGDRKQEQLELLINLTDEKLLTLISILSEYYDWENIMYIKNSKILEIGDINKYTSHY